MIRRKFCLLCLISILLGCNDLWTDSEIKVINDIYLYYSAGDGIRLGFRRGGGYSGILESTISEAYLLEQVLIVKVDPVRQGADTSFYQINCKYFNVFNRANDENMKLIEPALFEKLKRGHSEILKQHGWR